MKKGRRKRHKGHKRPKTPLTPKGEVGRHASAASVVSPGMGGGDPQANAVRVLPPEKVRPPQSGARPSGSLFWRIVRAPFVGVLNLLLALVLLFEEWGWKPLQAALAWLARFRLVARIEALIAGLPPYPSLAVFALPTTILFPVKIGALWLLAGGHVLTAGALLAGAKIVSTALVARIFTLTKPALMQIGWFARAYAWFVPWKEALFARVRESFAWRYGRMVKARVKQVLRRQLEYWRPRMRAVYQRLKDRAATMWRRYFGRSV